MANAKIKTKQKKNSCVHQTLIVKLAIPEDLADRHVTSRVLESELLYATQFLPALSKFRYTIDGLKHGLGADGEAILQLARYKPYLSKSDIAIRVVAYACISIS